MSLREIPYKPDYRTGHDNLVADFFRPCLLQARDYWRAVGYFSSTALESFGTPLGDFILRDGRIRLVTSVELSPGDLAAIAAGQSKQTICAQRVEQIIDTEFSDGMGDGTARLVRLLELGRLQIQIAVPKTGTGIYHEKIGVFLDGDDFLAFSGSSNESRNAFENNRECIDVFTSWDDSQRALRKRHHFEEIWNNADPGVSVYTFPQAARRKLLRVAKTAPQSRVTPPTTAHKWRHQDEAVTTFLRAERGVLEMATGTGKTRTALRILQTLSNRNDIATALVCADGNDLLRQWYRELLLARRSIVTSPRIYRHYDTHREISRFALSPQNAILLASRTP